ncbi:Glycosyltransferase involved in cell wall bisynthesis [Micromonospora pattaloongensis]|uniref:Glycosyltransferase involved in cell wall bisynthesis n=1 Tax=Micromonospora pattaloongensis TaxID=405436 RepID=A0A1H3HGE1_9ACTN|nr:glycosyltransferase [Micromonospora pattaloongensis]SDY14527.1 Glycosyltransferase involved in cell wall bisynthesis [Micromonospora pattaloongensis]
MTAPTLLTPAATRPGGRAPSRALQIAHFSDTYLPRRDGVISSLHTLTEALTAAGHGCLTVVPRHRQQPAAPELLGLRALACGVADLRLLPWPTNAQVERVAAWGPDLIHVHTPGPVGLLGTLVARRLGLPIVHTYHTDLHAYVDAYRIPIAALRLLVRLYARRLGVTDPPRADGRTRHGVVDAVNGLLLTDADAVVVPTPAVLARAGLPVPQQRIFLVPAAVPERAGTAGPAAFRDRYGIAPTDRVVLFVGRVNREKGVDLLLPAFARILAAEPQARLVLVGAVYERRWLRRLIECSGVVGDRVVVTGQLPGGSVADAYAAADVLAFPSRTDTQGLVLQEAALAGVPSVLADPVLHRSGAIGETAVLADGSPAGFAAAVTRLLRDPAAARRQGAAARARAVRHTPQRYGAAMLDVYRHALARAGS